jgi:hypothetical protein
VGLYEPAMRLGFDLRQFHLFRRNAPVEPGRDFGDSQFRIAPRTSTGQSFAGSSLCRSCHKSRR